MVLNLWVHSRVVSCNRGKSLCEDCVKAEYRAIKLRNKLQNDTKVLTDLLKEKVMDVLDR